jgi:hypothetical protein
MMHLLLDEKLLKLTRWHVVQFVRTLETSIDTTLSPCLEAVGKGVWHSRKNFESRVKQNIKRKFLSRSMRPQT